MQMSVEFFQIRGFLKNILQWNINQSPWVRGTDFDIKRLDPLHSHLVIKKVASCNSVADSALWHWKLDLQLAQYSEHGTGLVLCLHCEISK